MTATPDIKEVVLGEEDEFLVIACDGVWDVMEHQDVVDFCKPILEKTNDPQKAAEGLVAEAYKRGSTDNISVIVVSFKDWSGNRSSAKKNDSERG